MSDQDEERAVLEAAQQKLMERRQEYEEEKAKALGAGRNGELKPFAPPAILDHRALPPPAFRPFAQEIPGPSSKAAPLHDARGTVLYVVPPPDRSKAALESRFRSVVPKTFWTVSWANFFSVTNAAGRPSLGAVETKEGTLLSGAAAASYIWERTHDAHKIVILGATGAGKSLLASALCEHEVVQKGNYGVSWVHSLTLKEQGIINRARKARFLVLDDLGYELNNAKAGSGWIPNLAAPASDLLAQLYDVADQRVVITTYLDDLPMADLYGGAVTRRVYEGAVIIKLHRQ